MKKQFLILLIIFAASFGYSQKNYTVTFTELTLKMAQEPRPIIIKIYTDWCAICKLQNKQIEKDSNLMQLLVNNYYYIAFNAESHEAIVFNGKVYHFIPQGTGGINALAAELSKAKSSYPYWVFLDSDYKILFQYNGLLKSKHLNTLLKP
ncbi:thioredoxin family protein [Flavobacterium sp. NRK1]|uniref:thioredoxin family protein n=1 Tax=Flavobacterium sp. NRK1 TaxID=2954929 RepID=UPI0020932753|nr:thioredoxin family protein [Flavobacterium sp. NRK1]MCO6148204.1 thioredoxin family protein [Flavobacterium sp. NRK1]